MDYSTGAVFHYFLQHLVGLAACAFFAGFFIGIAFAKRSRRTKRALSVLTEMRYFNESHKMKKLAWNAINELDPEAAKLSEKEAYDKYNKG